MLISKGPQYAQIFLKDGTPLKFIPIYISCFSKIGAAATPVPPARRLLLNSVEISFQRGDFTPQDNCMAYNHGVIKVCGVLGSSGSIDQYSRQLHRFAKIKLRDVTWQRKVDPVLGNLMLHRLVLNLSYSFCQDDGCKIRMAAMDVLCFKKGFALHGPKIVT